MFLPSRCIARPVAAKERELPKGWHTAGSKPERAIVWGWMNTAARIIAGRQPLFLLEKSIRGFGTFMTNVPADSFRGKKIRLSGVMRSEHVEQWAGFWLRIDCKGEDRYTDETIKGEFDNMSGRPVKGTTGWKAYEVVFVRLPYPQLT